MILIAGEDEKVAEWAGLALGKPFVHPYCAFGIVEADGLLRGAAIFNNYQGPGANIELTYVGPGTLGRNILRELARYAFNACGASRVTIKTMRKNILVRKLLGNKRHGLEFEGVLKRYYDTEKSGDALVYVLHKDNAKRWLGD